MPSDHGSSLQYCTVYVYVINVLLFHLYVCRCSLFLMDEDSRHLVSVVFDSKIKSPVCFLLAALNKCIEMLVHNVCVCNKSGWDKLVHYQCTVGYQL